MKLHNPPPPLPFPCDVHTRNTPLPGAQALQGVHLIERFRYVLLKPDVLHDNIPWTVLCSAYKLSYYHRNNQKLFMALLNGGHN